MADCTVPARRECFCNYQFNVKACSVQGIYKTSDVVKNDPSSLACTPGTVDVMSETFHPTFPSLDVGEYSHVSLQSKR